MNFVALLPYGLRELCLRPCCPRKFGEFAKVKVMPNKLTEVQWRIAQSLEKRSKARRPSWGAIERSPEEGMRRRGVKEMLMRAQKVLIGCEFERRGSVYKGGVEVARYDGTKKSWVRMQGWGTMGLGDCNGAAKQISESWGDPGMGTAPNPPRGTAIDAGSWNANGARIVRVAAHLPCRVGVIVLQEVTMPEQVGFVASHG